MDQFILCVCGCIQNLNKAENIIRGKLRYISGEIFFLVISFSTSVPWLLEDIDKNIYYKKFPMRLVTQIFKFKIK